VRFWDTSSHAVSGDYLPHELREDIVIGPAVSPDGKVMVTRSELDHLQFWDIRTRKPITKAIKQPGIVYGMEFSSDGKWLFAKFPKHLTIWESVTGKLAAGPLRHDIYSYAHWTKNNQLVTLENNDRNAEVWRSQLVIRSVDGFAEIRRIALEGHAREASWVDDSHVLVVADNKMPGDKGPYSYGRKLIYLVSLAADAPQVATLMRRDWISNVHVAPDGGYFIICTREETSCWKVGQAKPVGVQPGNHLVYVGDKDWVVLHNGPAIAHSLADGKELWRKEPVGIARVIGANIWTCNEKEMEVWKVESEELR
jgi:WD40 repeat protein